MSAMEDQLGYVKDPPKRREGFMGRAETPKNRMAATVQITAEQILREAHEHKELAFKPPKQKITDPQELADYRMRKRKEFEDNLKRQKQNMGAWVKYALWEASQNQFERARSVFERALDVDYRNPTLWLKFAEMEMKHRFVNSARNVWDRAVAILPRIDQFWYKYAYMEEMLGNVAGGRQIFERWMNWQPDFNGWNSFIKFEMRHKQIEKARNIFERFLLVHNEVRTYVKYAKFEEKHGTVARARTALERAFDELAEDGNDPELFIFFAKFEERQKEVERARSIYKHALDNVPKSKATELYNTYVAFEKMHGDKAGVEEVILSKRRFQYEAELKKDPRNYDVWFDYIRLEESAGEMEKVRSVYERGISHLPPIEEKRFWKRYMFIWVNFALYEELVAKDLDRTRAVYMKALEIVPHASFTFSKLWILLAHFEVRQNNLDRARKVLGTAMGKCPRERVIKAYIDLELKLGNIERCRKLYEKYLEFMPENCYAWSKFAELETSLAEIERARGIFELAVGQPVLDMPEVLWKAFIDFEIKNKDHERTRALYKRLLDRTKHVKVWVSRAQFEATIKDLEKARAVFVEADGYFKSRDEKEDRLILLEAWRDFEKNFGSQQTLADVKAKLPRRLKKKRQLKAEDGTDAGWEEYYDYQFPDEESKGSNLKILEMARKWKKQKIVPAKPASSSDDDDDEDE